MAAEPDMQSISRRLHAAARLARTAFALTWRASPPLLLAVLGLALLEALVTPAALGLSKLVLDRAALDLGLGGVQPGGLAVALPLGAWIALAAGVLALGQLVGPFSRTLEGIAGDRLTGSTGEETIRAANRWRGLARFEDPALADDLRRVRQQGTWAGLKLLQNSLDAALAFVTIGALAVVLWGLHPLAPALLVAGGLPHAALQWAFWRRAAGHLYFKTPESRKLEDARDALLDPEPAKDVRLYGLGPFWGRRYEGLWERTIGDLDRLRRRLALRIALASLQSSLAAGGVYIYTVWGIARGALTLGDLALYGGAATLLQARLNVLGDRAAFLPEAFGLYLPALDRIMNAPPDLPVPAAPHPVPTPIRKGFRFEDVWFSYPGAPQPVLRGVSFRLAPGESLALVGRNGAGKTTIVKLLLRLYDPTAGRVTLDGVDLREYDPEALRARAAAVFQDYARYELTAGENIAAGDLGALGDEPRLLEAAGRGGAGGLVAGLPEGLETRVGREFGGRELSEGEWQALALSRAFVRDAELLVLDEPTASLDVRAEYAVYRRFAELTRGRMTLLISHRFTTVRMADRIAYLEGGRVAEEGAHGELMARGGGYARLYGLQAERYRDAGPEGAGA